MRAWAVVLAGVLVLALLPIVGGNYALRLGTTLAMYVVLAVSWSFIGGMAGYPSFATAAFFGLGAYTSAILEGTGVPMVLACAERQVPLLGVCLGHQAIGAAFGGRIVRARSIMHGKVSSIEHDGRGLFEGIENPFEATRYHSLVIDPAACPAVLEVAARTADREIMSVRHRERNIVGVQFHPESILTRVGKRLLANFLGGCRSARAA